MILKEFEENGYDLEKLKPYENFPIECLKKDYSVEFINRHHILPKCMGGSNKKDNIIVISIDDHIDAHFILANCFPKYAIEYKNNIKAVGKIQSANRKWITKGIENIHEYLSEIHSGERNHFYKKKHTEETKKKIGDKNRGNRYALGCVRSLETRQKLRIAQTLVQQSKPKIELPEGVYYCDVIIDGKKKSVYRFCPECNVKLYHLLRPDAVRFHKKKMPCFLCAMKKRRKIEND